MEVQFLPNESLTLAQLPSVPIRSPIELIKNLRSVYAQKQVEIFRDMLDSLISNDKFDIHDLDTIMMDAIRNNDTQFTLELLSHGLPLLPDYALEATKWKAKNFFELFFEKGWDINKPISQAQPPLLR
jgi:hypothetical protein